MPFADLVQAENPPQGYMHNNNVTPFGMMRDSPLTPRNMPASPISTMRPRLPPAINAPK